MTVSDRNSTRTVNEFSLWNKTESRMADAYVDYPIFDRTGIDLEETV